MAADDIMSRDLQDILIRHWLFSVLPGRTIADLANQFSIKNYTKDQYVFHQEDRAERLYVILNGEISIESYNLDGTMTKITHLRGGEIFGEFGLIDEKGRSAAAIIAKRTTLASLPSNVFQKLLDAYPEFSRRLLQVLVARLRGSNHQIESLVTLSLIQRTAQLLLRLSDAEGLEIKITQGQLSERLYASREKVNRKLAELVQMGAIKTGHGKILIESKDRLGALLDEF